MIEPETLLPKTNPARALDPIFCHFFMGPYHQLFYCVIGLQTLHLLAIPPQHGNVLKALTFSKTFFIQRSVFLLLPSLSLPLQPHFSPQVSWTTSIISLCRPSSAPEIPCTAPRSQQRLWELNLIVLGFYLLWSLSSFETVDTTILFISLKIQSLRPLSSLVSSSQAPWKALTHLPLNVIIPQP